MSEISVPYTTSALALMPAMDTAQAKARYSALVEYVHSLLEDGRDYGVIPGTGSKPVLLKPGAEKLATFFGLTKRFVLVKAVEDYTGKDHGGEPFFSYWFTGQLWRGDLLIAEADGACNSWESRYRWRESKRLCPACGAPAIIKGRAEYGGGWLCHRKQGGCGAKFADEDQAILSQPIGRVANPDAADIANTCLKIGQKRAFIAVVLLGVNASEFFTQDMEDLVPPPSTSADQSEDGVPPERTEAPDRRRRAAQPPPTGQPVPKLARPMDPGTVRKAVQSRAERGDSHAANTQRTRELGTFLLGLFPGMEAAQSKVLARHLVRWTCGHDLDGLTIGQCDALLAWASVPGKPTEVLKYAQAEAASVINHPEIVEQVAADLDALRSAGTADAEDQVEDLPY